jgi:hypothetical protein
MPAPTDNYSVRCPYCGAEPTQRCVSRTGRRARLHDDRTAAHGAKWRSSDQVYVVLHDDADNGLTTGELVVGLPHWLDELTTVTVKANLTSTAGFSPVNQHLDNLHSVGWADDNQARQFNIAALVDEGRAAVTKRHAAEAARIRSARAAARAAKKAARAAQV